MEKLDVGGYIKGIFYWDLGSMTANTSYSKNVAIEGAEQDSWVYCAHCSGYHWPMIIWARVVSPTLLYVNIYSPFSFTTGIVTVKFNYLILPHGFNV